jgi:uncharacterized protein YehS (DUF1456 family)
MKKKRTYFDNWVKKEVQLKYSYCSFSTLNFFERSFLKTKCTRDSNLNIEKISQKLKNNGLLNLIQIILWKRRTELMFIKALKNISLNFIISLINNKFDKQFFQRP